MRAEYPNINIIGSGEPLFDELFASLKYSTHGEFKIISDTKRHDISSSHHFEYISPKNSDYPFKHAKFTIGFFNKKFLFFSGNKINKIESLGSEDYELLNSCFEKFVCTAREMLQTKKLTLDFLINHNGDPHFLGAQIVKRDIIKVFDSNSTISRFFKTNFNSELRAKNMVGRLEVDFNESSNETPHIVLNDFGKHWVGYRSFGINIPLLIVQNLLLRDFKTLKLLDDRDVRIDRSYVEPPRYEISFSSAYFDLDETIMCKSKPIKPVISLIYKFLNSGKKVYLITRHTGIISDSLASVGVDPNIFAEIIYVEPDMLKSEFIECDSIFIDNEFPQRRDVRDNCKIPCLDLDQIEFLAGYYAHKV